MNGMQSCRFLCIRALVVCGLLLVSAANLPARAQQATDRAAGVFSVPSEEHHIYDLDFIFFRKLAEGELKLEKTERPGVLRAELVGRTRGIAAWLTGDRTQRYIALMEKQEDGSLRSLTYESHVLKKKSGLWQTTRKRYLYDAQQQKVFLEKEKKGSFAPVKDFALEEGQHPVDILTGFFNLRAGHYGTLLPGRHVELLTVGSNGLTTIEVDVLTAEQRQGRDSFPAGGLLLQVKLDPEVFETTDGGMYLWFDEAGQPARGVVEDVIGLGDVRGYLREEKSP
jgi:hypothetical protein